MTAKVLPFRGGKQPEMNFIAPLDEADVEDLFPPEADPIERVGLAAIAAAMNTEALRTGESVRHLETGCSMRLRAKDDRRCLVAWRTENVPADSELKTLKQFFQIPPSRVVSWETSGSRLVAVFRWDAASGHEVYQDYATIAEIRTLVDGGRFREARDQLWRVHGNREKGVVFDLMMDAEGKAQEVPHADAL